MQKIYLTIALATAAYWASAQSIFPTNGDNVGIGIPAPSEKLTIRDPNIAYDAGSGIVKIRFDSGGGGGGIGFEKETFNTGGLRFYTQFGYGSMLEKMRIAANGNMGIGTTGPGAKLEIAGTGTSLFIDNNQFSANRNPLTGGVVDAARGSSVILLSSSTSGGNLEFFTNSITGGTINERMRITETGNVGIGTISPGVPLDVAGTVRSTVSEQSVTGLILTNSNASFNNSLLYGYTTRTGSTAFKLLDLRTNSGSTNAMYIDGNGNGYFAGNIGIGTTDNKGYTFAVNGSAIATSMTVKLYANWPDYVFKKEYKLPSLLEVKSYIDKNQHLPGMPSEQEVAKDGINLGEMNKLLTKKIEELTLYLIEKDKFEKEQAETNSQLSEQLKLQQEQIVLLMKQVAELSKEKTNEK